MVSVKIGIYLCRHPSDCKSPVAARRWQIDGLRPASYHSATQ